MQKFLSIFGLGLLAVACSTGGLTVTAVPTASAPPSSYNVATGSGDLIVQVSNGGGLVPPGYALTHLPAFALYGDGRILVKAPTDAIYPGPLLPDLRRMSVTGSEIQKIVAAADQAGLLGADARFDAVGIFDAGTTTFSTVVDGTTHTISAYALDYEGVTASPGTADARGKLTHFEAQIGDLSTLLGRAVGDGDVYDALGLRLFASPVDSADAGTVTRKTLAWPLSVDPGTAGEATQVPATRCIFVSGTDLAAFVVAAKSADMLTIWSFGSVHYSVAVRPIYPDESGCPAA